MPRKKKTARKGGWIFGCLGRCKRRTIRAANEAAVAVTGGPLAYVSKKDEALLEQEDRQRKAEAEVEDEKEIEAARVERRKVEARAAAVKAERERKERLEAEAAQALADERQSQETEARRAREAKEAAKAVEIRKLEKIIETATRKEADSRQAEKENIAKLAGVSDPDTLVARKEIIRRFHDYAMEAKGEIKKAEGALEALRRGGRRSRRRKTHQRRR